MNLPSSAIRSSENSEERIGTVDVLRGFALFGILLANAAVLTGILTSDGPATPLQLWVHFGTADRIADAVIAAFFQGRFYLLFAFLFGYSFILQLDSSRGSGTPTRIRVLRRGAALGLIGSIHAVLLWFGDILTLYAVFCPILLCLRKIRPATALCSGAALYLAFSLLAFHSGGGGDWDSWLLVDRLRTGYAGTPLDTFAIQTDVAVRFTVMTWAGQGIPSFAMVLVGFAAGKAKLLHDPARLPNWTSLPVWTGLVIGIPVSTMTFADTAGITAAPSFWPGVQELVNPFITIAYAYLILEFARMRRGAHVARWMASAGRMSASNYIGQSLLMMVLYSGYGLALTPTGPVVIALGITSYAALVLASRQWLRVFHQGPVEWVLRAATYWGTPRSKHGPRPHRTAS
ncbi:DUF418 domain-containing protein [Nocardia sp. NPDC052254]|uniref:DUF418 domain-containing protein n=1 Tax=Nocardia sp. NPDC052254 TaxID=3155681 RepID=UPI003414A931